MKSLIVAMLNYGAAAQTYFGYNTDSLVNSKLSDDQKALITVYVGAVYTGTDGVTYSSGIMAYSIGAYGKTLANGTSTIAPLAKATAVYSCYATLNFNK